MPRGNTGNLVRNEDLTPEERRNSASKAGKASVKARRKKKQLKEAIELCLECKYEDKDSGKKVSGTDAMARVAVKAAIQGDWKAWELVRDTTGQKPVERIAVAEVPAETIDEIEALVFGDGGSGDDD